MVKSAVLQQTRSPLWVTIYAESLLKTLTIFQNSHNLQTKTQAGQYIELNIDQPKDYEKSNDANTKRKFFSYPEKFENK